jgi:DNA-binding beta-propeller fold protein YncE
MRIEDNSATRTVSRIDPATGRVVATVAIPQCCDGELAIGLGSVWVTASSDKTVWRIDPTTNRVVGKIKVNGENHSLATGAGAVWVQGLESNLVTRIDPNR